MHLCGMWPVSKPFFARALFQILWKARTSERYTDNARSRDVLHKPVPGKNPGHANRFSVVGVKTKLKNWPFKNRGEAESFVTRVLVEANLYPERKLKIVNHKQLWLKANYNSMHNARRAYTEIAKLPKFLKFQFLVAKTSFQVRPSLFEDLKNAGRSINRAEKFAAVDNTTINGFNRADLANTTSARPISRTQRFRLANKMAKML